MSCSIIRCFASRGRASSFSGVFTAARMPNRAPTPTTASSTPNTVHTPSARRWAAGLVHTPQVMPIVQMPLARWNTHDSTPTR